MLSYVICQYDQSRYPFSAIVAEHLGVSESRLDRIHEFVNETDRTSHGTDQNSEFHKRLYDAGGGAFAKTYMAFLRDVVAALLNEPFLAQKMPNFRVQFPGNIAVERFHRDRDHGHDRSEINIWLPLTPVSESSAVWVESWEGRADYHPAVPQPGRFLVFDGANLAHGNRTNTSGRTRMSIDFRVVPARLFQDREVTTVNTATRFARGQYFFEELFEPAAVIP